ELSSAARQTRTQNLHASSEAKHDAVARNSQDVANVLPGIAILACYPDFAAPCVHPLENLLSVKRTFNVLLSCSLTCGAKNFQLLDGRYKVDRFLAALFFS